MIDETNTTTIAEDNLERYLKMATADTRYVRELNELLQLICYRCHYHGWDNPTLIRYSESAVDTFFLQSTKEVIDLDLKIELAERLMAINRPRFEQALAACSVD